MLSPLTLHHERMGALLGQGETPLRYRDVVEEYWVLKKGAGMVDISHLGRLMVLGKDRVSFLNGLLTNDLSKMQSEIGLHSLLLNTKARVLANLYLYGLEDRYLMDTGETPASRVKAILDQFIITENVQLKDSTEDLLQITVQGPKSPDAIRQVLGVDVQGLAPLSYKTEGPSLIIARDRTGLGGYDIVVARDEIEAVWQGFLLKGDQVEAVGLDALDILRLEIGLPKFGVDVDENFIALEAGFKDAVSFTKGCYMGQETVARATHIGRVNRTLVRLDVEGKNSPGPRAKLLSDGREVGFLTSVAFSPGRGSFVGLGYVHRDLSGEGTKLIVDSQGTGQVAVVVKAV